MSNVAEEREMAPPEQLPTLAEALAAYGAEIYRYLRRQVETAEDAADLHQETFLRAHRAYGRLSPGANVRAWLFRIASNLATDAYRRRRPQTQLTDLVRSRDVEPELVTARRELKDAVRSGLLGLSERQRAAVVLHVFEGRGYGEVAEILDCTEVTARKHVSLGLGRLREGLSEWR